MIKIMHAPSLSLFMGSIALSLGVTAAQAQDISIGRAVFGNTCSRCHGLPPSLLYGADIAAGDPSRIESAIGKVRAMATLRDRITEQDMRDISAYLDRPFLMAANAGDEAERLFAWAEWKYQATLQPRVPTGRIGQYLVRYYAKSGLYIGVAQEQVWLYDESKPEAGVQRLGTTESFLGLAKSEGF
jgi:mono/diheme cytochrome c family protein